MQTPLCLRTDVRRRGSVLVLVLAVTSIVGVIGLSSLLAVRVEHRNVQARADAAQAQQLADGALQLIHTRLGENNNWRSTYTHDTWTADEPLTADATLRFKLADVDDTDLADDENDDARLTVRVAVGSAVRLASIELKGTATLGPELVVNGDIEAGSSPFGINIGSSTVNAATDNPQSGSAYLLHSGRATALAAWDQDLSGKIESDKTYRLSVWVRTGSSEEQVTVGLYYPYGLIQLFKEVTGTANENGWTLLEGDVTPSFSHTPSVMDVYGRASFTNQDVHIDNLSVREVLGGDGVLPVVRGTYRRELDN